MSCITPVNVGSALVVAGLGVCLVPALTVLAADHARKAVRLDEINLESRRIVAMVPSQYLRIAPYSGFQQALQDAGKSIRLPRVEPMPPFISGIASKPLLVPVAPERDR